LLEAAVVDMKRPDRTVIFWDVDAPATLDRVMNDPLDPFASLIPQYDLILTYGGGAPVVEAYEFLGACECIPIYNALDPSTHYPVLPDSRFRSDLAFCGNRLPDRETRVEEFFFKPAGSMTGHSFLLGGNGWKDKAIPENIQYVGHLYTRDHNAFNCTPRYILNISRASMAKYGYSPATRVFEAAGAGACIITDHWEGINTFLEPEKEILVAYEGKDVADYLKTVTPDFARTVGEAARKRVLAEHTYDHRAEQLEKVLRTTGILQGRKECLKTNP
jgi:spore maturation protein CgeB